MLIRQHYLILIVAFLAGCVAHSLETLATNPDNPTIDALRSELAAVKSASAQSERDVIERIRNLESHTGEVKQQLDDLMLGKAQMRVLAHEVPADLE